MANEDRDLSTVDALPDPDAQPTPATQADALATALQTTAAGIGTDSGTAPEAAAADAAAAATTTRNLASAAATTAEAVRILKKAAAAWKKNAPKKVEIEAAEKAVTDAKAALATAQQAEDDSLSDGAKALAKQQVKTASDALDKAIEHLQKLQADLKAADEAYDREWKKAVAKLNSLSKGQVSDDAPATGAPGPTQSTGAGTGSSSPAARTGSGTPAAKPGGTPAATPGTGKPTETITSTSSAAPTSKPDPGIASLLSSLGQQSTAQQPQAQPAAQPTAAQPAATAPQSQQNQQGQNKKQEGVIDLDDISRELGETPGAIVAGLGSVSPSSTSSTAAPVANGSSTELRPPGTPITGTSLGGAPAVNTQASHTTGSSAANLTTQSDVTGRSTPPATATSPAPGTSTSGAHGTGTAPGQGTQQQTTGARPMGGMPMMPGMMPPAPAAPAARSGDGETRPGVVRYQDGEVGRHGEEALKEATPGGTIAQNRDKPAA